jgi:hypothetical protein
MYQKIKVVNLGIRFIQPDALDLELMIIIILTWGEIARQLRSGIAETMFGACAARVERKGKSRVVL